MALMLPSTVNTNQCTPSEHGVDRIALPSDGGVSQALLPSTARNADTAPLSLTNSTYVVPFDVVPMTGEASTHPDTCTFHRAWFGSDTDAVALQCRERGGVEAVKGAEVQVRLTRPRKCTGFSPTGTSRGRTTMAQCFRHGATSDGGERAMGKATPWLVATVSSQGLVSISYRKTSPYRT